MKLSKAVHGYRSAKLADGYSEQTLEGYQWAYDLMIAHLGDQDIESITPEDLQAFVAWLRTDYTPNRRSRDRSPLTNLSLDKVWIAVRSLYNWAVPELNLLARPDAALKRPRGLPKVVSPFSDEEIKKLLKAAANTKLANTTRRVQFQMRRPTALRDTALILTLLDTGLRVSEAARLKVGDVNLETGEVAVNAFGSGRKSRSRHVYLGKSSRRALWKYLADREEARKDDFIFLTAANRPMNRNSIRLVISRIGNRAGVLHVHPHRFRHTFAIEYLRGGGDVFTLQRILGHSSLEMVRHYLALADVDAAEAHRKAGPVDRWRL